MYGSLSAFLLVAGIAQAVSTPLDPAQAIARSDAAPNRQAKLDYAMTVASTQRTPKGVYLHSTDDYRRADDLTLLVVYPLADRLAKRTGGPIEQTLKGKRIVVRGVLMRMPIVNSFSQRAVSMNRIQHEVRVQTPGQIISID